MVAVRGSVDSVVEVQALVYLLSSLERGSTVYTCVCGGGVGVRAVGFH